LASMKIMSNMTVAATASTATFGLPGKVTLPAPFQEDTEVKQGFCFNGMIGKPASCGKDPICGLVETMLAKTRLRMEACVSPTATRFSIGIGEVTLSKTVILSKASLYFALAMKQPSVEFGAEASLKIKMKDWVKFYGSLYLKQAGAQSLIGFKFKTVGMIPRAFGIGRLNLFDLYLNAEVGVAGGAPTVNKIVIGGGICIGQAPACKKLMATAPPTERVAGRELAYLGARTRLTNLELGESELLGDEVDEFDQLQSQSQARLQHLVNHGGSKVPGAMAAKIYVGFEAASGNAFFYAAISKMTLGEALMAVVGAEVKLHWLGQLAISGFDEKACKAGKKDACWAYATFATQPTTLDLEPPLKIQMGLTLSFRISFLGTSMGAKMSVIKNGIDMTIEGPAINLFKGQVVMSKSQKERKLGPVWKVVAMPGRFSGKIKSYTKLGWIAQGEAEIAIEPTRYYMSFKKVALFFGPIMGSITVSITVAPVALQILSVNLHEGKLGELIKAAARALLKGITAICDAIEKTTKGITKTFKNAQRTLQNAQKKLDDASKKCKTASNNLNKKKKSCGEEKFRRLKESPMELSLDDSTNLVQSEWGAVGKAVNKGAKAVGKGVKKGVKAVGKGAKKAASAICKTALSGLSKVMRGVCEAPIKIAKAGLSGAQATLKGAETVYNAAVQIVRSATAKLKEVTKFLTEVSVKTVGFKATSVAGGRVTLKVAIKMSKKMQKFSVSVDLKAIGRDVGKLAAQLVNYVFKKVADAAKKFVGNLKKKLGMKKLRMEEEMERIESEMESEARASYMQSKMEAVRMREEEEKTATERVGELGEAQRAMLEMQCQGVVSRNGVCYAEKNIAV